MIDTENLTNGENSMRAGRKIILFRYGLRSLFIFVSLICILGWFGFSLARPGDFVSGTLTGTSGPPFNQAPYLAFRSYADHDRTKLMVYGPEPQMKRIQIKRKRFGGFDVHIDGKRVRPNPEFTIVLLESEKEMRRYDLAWQDVKKHMFGLDSPTLPSDKFLENVLGFRPFSFTPVRPESN